MIKTDKKPAKKKEPEGSNVPTRVPSRLMATPFQSTHPCGDATGYDCPVRGRIGPHVVPMFH